MNIKSKMVQMLLWSAGLMFSTLRDTAGIK